MDKYINKLIRGFKKVFNKKYVAVISVFVGIISVLGFTYGYFSQESGWQLASQLKVRELYYTMTIDGSSVSNISVAANSGTTYHNIVITSLNDINTRYSLTYKATGTVTVATSSKSVNRQEGVIGLYSTGTTAEKTKTIRVAITNNTASAVKVTFNVAGGYTWNAESQVSILSGYSRISTIKDEAGVSYGLTLAEEVNAILNCTPTATSPCLYKENANNYLTYGGYTWRIMGTYLLDNKSVVKLVLSDKYSTAVTYSNTSSKLSAFYSSMSNTSLVRTSSPFTCTGTTTVSCSGSTNYGLVSKVEYDLIGGVNSYLYTIPDINYWLGTTYYVGTSRGSKNLTSSSTAYVRPSIYLKYDVVNANHGEYGTPANPYQIAQGYQLSYLNMTNATSNLPAGYYPAGKTYTLSAAVHSDPSYIFSKYIKWSGTGASIVGNIFTMGSSATVINVIWGREYNYTGTYDTYTTAMTGYYYIEAYGAQGGDAYAAGGYTGGKGGYTSGYVYMDNGETFYIYVGGQGDITSESANQIVDGGYNGGGDGLNGCANCIAGSGGGATDIRYFISGPSSSDLAWNSTAGKRARIMVAGGGGGSYYSSSVNSVGGNGGNLTGGSSTTSYNGTTYTAAGGTQTGVYWGFGETGDNYTPGGGGGYYGGKANHYTAGGGSSFISGYTGCNAINSSGTHTGNSVHFTGVEFEKGKMTSGVRSGNGYAKILYIGDDLPNYPLYDVMKTLATVGDYATTYSGASNDTYGKSATKTIYYINPKTTSLASDTLNAINVKFAGFCWQMFRTTDTGGVKLIYNGDPDANGYCQSQTTTATHASVNGGTSTTVAMGSNYKYADSFTYSGTTFTLVNATTYNYANNKNLIGKYTCRNNNATSTCTTLYNITGPNPTNSNSPYVVKYTVGTTKNAQIGTSAFNGSNLSPAYVGYKYGYPNIRVGTTAPNSGDTIMGDAIVWDGTKYILKDDEGNNATLEYYDFNGGNATGYYTCMDSTPICGTYVYYYYSGNNYAIIENGDTVATAVTRMMTANTYNSAMKAYLETWYKNNIAGTVYDDYIEQNAVYCNDRSTTSTTLWPVHFKNYNTVQVLSCTNNTDKFSKGNTAAQLNYPIGLVTLPEWQLMTNGANIKKAGAVYWTLSPTTASNSGTVTFRYISTSGSSSSTSPLTVYAVRPVITLAPLDGVTLTGSGTLDDPYEIN